MNKNRKIISEANRMKTIRSMLKYEILHRLNLMSMSEVRIQTLIPEYRWISNRFFHEAWSDLLVNRRIEMIGVHYCPVVDDEVPYYIAYEEGGKSLEYF